jgi:hypothetical protein
MPSAEKASKRPAQPEYPITTMGIFAPIVGWIIPGGGHFIQQKWVRGLLLLVSVAAMFFVGLGMQGKIYDANTGDILDMLGFIGDLGNGGLYFLTRILGWGTGAIAIATADYGTKFLIVAGLLNVISAVDAHQIAIGKKP